MTNLFSRVFSSLRSQRVPPTKTIGSMGTAIFGGFIQEDERNAKLQGTQKYTTYSTMLANVTVIAAGVRYFLNLLGKADWRVEPADDSPRAKELAELIEDMMDDMSTPWTRVVRRAAMYRFYGFSIQEWTAKRRPDGQIGIKDIAPRAQKTIERWDVDPEGTLFGVTQRLPETGEERYLPRPKIVYAVDDSLNDSPQGLGLFRHIVQAAQRLTNYEELEGFGFETDLRGLPVGRAPLQELQDLVDSGQISTADKLALEEPIRAFVVNHLKNPKLSLLLDSTTYQTLDEASRPSNIPKWSVELLQSSPTGQKEVASAIVRVTREIARVLGVENILLGDGQGSFALSKDKSHNFALIVDSTLKELVEVFDKDFVDIIFGLNGFDKALKPKLKTEAIQYRDITQITTALRELATAGVSLRAEDEAVGEVFDQLGLTRVQRDMDEIDEMIKPVNIDPDDGDVDDLKDDDDGNNGNNRR